MKRIVVILVLGATLAWGVGVSGGAAAASKDTSSVIRGGNPCLSTWVCWFTGHNYGGVGLAFESGGTGWVDTGDTALGNNTLSSWSNLSNDDARWARNAGGNGEQFCVDAHTSNAGLTGDRDDDAGSIRRYTTNDVCGA